MLHRLLTDITDHIAENNANPIDVKLTNGNYAALVHHARLTAPGWITPSSSYTVPAGKKAVVVFGLPALIIQNTGDPNNRKWRLRDTAKGVNIGEFHPNGLFGFNSQDDSTPSAEAPAGSVLAIELWNKDTTPRTMGGALIFRIVNA